MASGDTLAFSRVGNIETLNPSSSGVVETFKKRNTIPVAVFPDAVNRAIGFGFQMPNHYDGGKVIATVGWMAVTATTGNVLWIIQIARIEDDVDDLDLPTYISSDFFGVTASSAGRVAYSTKEIIVANLSDVAPGDYFRIIIRRVGGDGGDTLSDDAQFLFFAMREF